MWVGPNPVTGVLVGQEDVDTDRGEGQGRVETEETAEGCVCQPRTTGATRSHERGLERILPQSLQEDLTPPTP